MAYSSRQAQLVTAAYQKYLHRTPSSAEIQREVDEAARRGENESQWQARIDNHFRQSAPAPAPAAPKPAAPAPAPAKAPAPAPAPAINLGKYSPYDQQQLQALAKQYPGVSPSIVEYLYQEVKGNRLSSGEMGIALANAAQTPYVTNALPRGYTPTTGDDQPLDRAIREAQAGQARNTAKIIPGAAPNLGVIPSGQIVDLITGERVDKADATTQALAKAALANRNIPKYVDIQGYPKLSSRGYQFAGEPSAEEQALQARLLAGDQSAAGPLAAMRSKRLQVTPKGNPALDQALQTLAKTMVVTGMGYALTPAVGALLASGAGAGAAGVGTAGTFAASAPAFTAGVTGGLGLPAVAAAPLSAGLVGSGIGAWQAGASGQDVGKGAALGGATSLAGGAAGELAKSLGAAGPGIRDAVIRGAAGGVGGSAAGAGLTHLLGGDANPYDILRGAAGGAVKGAVGATAGGLLGVEGSKDIKKMLADFIGSQAGGQTRQFLQTLLPGDPSHFAPEAPKGSGPKLTPELIAAARDAAIADFKAKRDEAMALFREKIAAFNEAKARAYEEAKAAAMGQYEAKRAEWEGKKSAALARRDAQMAEYRGKAEEFQSQRQVALERLRTEALEFMQRARAARGQALPVIPTPPAPPLPSGIAPITPGNPDPFTPTATSQTFAGDFPVSGGPSSGGDFPVSQEGAAPTATAAPARRRTQASPLNLLQIKAALDAAKRRG